MATTTIIFLSPKRWADATSAIGIYSKAGMYGGTYGNHDIAKINYHIHTDTIKDHLIVPELPKQFQIFTYAIVADVLNVAMFGKQAVTREFWGSRECS